MIAPPLDRFKQTNVCSKHKSMLYAQKTRNSPMESHRMTVPRNAIRAELGRPPGIATDQLDGLVTVLDLIRSGAARTRPDLPRQAALRRTVISQRLGQLIASGLGEAGAPGPCPRGPGP